MSKIILTAMSYTLLSECHERFNWAEPAENKVNFLRQGYNPFVDRHKNIADKVMNKEERSFWSSCTGL